MYFFYSFYHIIVQRFEQLVDTALYKSIIIIIIIIIIITINVIISFLFLLLFITIIIIRTIRSNVQEADFELDKFLAKI